MFTIRGGPDRLQIQILVPAVSAGGVGWLFTYVRHLHVDSNGKADEHIVMFR